MGDFMLLKQLKVGSLDNFTYIVGDEVTRECAVIDPGAQCERIIAEMEKEGMRAVLIINTHGHFDHTGCNENLARLTGARIAAHELTNVRHELPLKDGDSLRVGDLELAVLHTPGHSPDSICILVEDNLFTGDTVFVDECGRVDLPGSDARALFHSFFDKILLLDDSIRVFPGHDYGPRPSSTIGRERDHNYTLQPRSLDEFLRFMLG